MNRATVVGLAAAITLASSVAHADSVSREVDASADGTVSISNVSGSVEVSGWSRNRVAVDADLGPGVEELIVERDGDEVLIKVKTPHNSRRDISSRLVVRVPEDSSLDIAGVSADIEVRDVFGEQRLHAVSGDIETEVYASDISADVVSGDIEVQGDGKEIHTQVTSVSGDVDVVNVAGDIKASSVSGEVTVTDGAFDRAEVNTVNGDIVFRASLARGGRLDMESINGSIDLEFEGDIEGRFDIESFNGAIRNCFGPDPQRTSRFTPGRELKFSQGDGSARITIRTLNGNLRMCRD